jgi:hypothetical protein
MVLYSSKVQYTVYATKGANAHVIGQFECPQPLYIIRHKSLRVERRHQHLARVDIVVDRCKHIGAFFGQVDLACNLFLERLLEGVRKVVRDSTNEIFVGMEGLFARTGADHHSHHFATMHGGRVWRLRRRHAGRRRRSELELLS